MSEIRVFVNGARQESQSGDRPAKLLATSDSRAFEQDIQLVLAPGRKYWSGYGSPTNVPGSPYKVGLRLNYDRRVRGMIDVASSERVRLKRVLWNPRASWL